jgi:hypothetical protein
MEAILSFMPHEEQVKYSAMTGQSLFYMGETDLKHKILAIVEEEGAELAAYALKLLQSEGELTIASTGKDPSTGRLETQEYRVEGPVRRLLVQLDEMVSKRCAELAMERCDFRFSRRDVRAYCGWSYEQIRVHLERLVNLEYLLVHSGGRGQSFVYELLFDGELDDGRPHLMRLINVESLKS